MFEVRQTREFSAWLDGLRDRRAAAYISARIRRLALGRMGDARSLGDGVSELRVRYGPGYRLYFVRRGDRLVPPLRGGVKKGQNADIARAKRMAKEMNNGS